MTDLDLEFKGDVLIARFPARIDLSNTAEVIQPIRQKVEEGTRYVLIDLSATRTIDSTALGALVQIYKSLRSEGACQLACASDSVMKVLAITRLGRILVIHDNVDAAYSELSRLAVS